MMSTHYEPLNQFDSSVTRTTDTSSTSRVHFHTDILWEESHHQEGKEKEGDGTNHGITTPSRIPTSSGDTNSIDENSTALDPFKRYPKEFREDLEKVRVNDPHLNEFWCICCQLNPAGCKLLVDEFAKNTTLRAIIMCDNDIGDEGAKALGKFLATNTTLIMIDMGSNNIGDEGAIALGEALAQNKTLKSFSLSLNNISDEGFKALMDGLAQNVSLRELTIDRNEIGNEGAKALVEVLAKNTTLKKIDVSHNFIDDQGHIELAQGLENKKEKIEIVVEGNPIGDKGKKVIFDRCSAGSIYITDTSMISGNKAVARNKSLFASVFMTRDNLCSIRSSSVFQDKADMIATLIETSSKVDDLSEEIAKLKTENETLKSENMRIDDLCAEIARLQIENDSLRSGGGKKKKKKEKKEKYMACLPKGVKWL